MTGGNAAVRKLAYAYRVNRRAFLASAAALAAPLAACGRTQAAPAALPVFPMRRGVNLGNALEAPHEGDWGYTVAPAHLAAIKAAGFDGVRLPVRWDLQTEATRPHRIAPALLSRVSAIAAYALALGLKIQIDVHHYEALNADPRAERARFLAIWRQIAEAFAGAPPGVIFELLNEPNGPAWTGATLTDLQGEAARVIRTTHPHRLIVFGGPNWNSIDGLSAWSPPDTTNAGVTVHYYEPHAFTHENAGFLGAEAPRFGRPWGTDADISAVRAHAKQAADWARAVQLPLQLGEFGVNAAVPVAQRALWTREVRTAFESEGASWCAWDFAGAFPIWDLSANTWIAPLRDALIEPVG